MILSDLVFVVGGVGAGVVGGAGVMLVACWGLRLLSKAAPFALASSSTGLVYMDLVLSGRVAIGGGGGSSSSSSGTFGVDWRTD